MGNPLLFHIKATSGCSVLSTAYLQDLGVVVSGLCSYLTSLHQFDPVSLSPGSSCASLVWLNALHYWCIWACWRSEVELSSWLKVLHVFKHFPFYKICVTSGRENWLFESKTELVAFPAFHQWAVCVKPSFLISPGLWVLVNDDPVTWGILLVSWIIKGRFQCIAVKLLYCLEFLMASRSQKNSVLGGLWWVTWTGFENADCPAPPPGGCNPLGKWGIGISRLEKPLWLLLPKQSPSALDRQSTLWTVVFLRRFMHTCLSAGRQVLRNFKSWGLLLFSFLKPQKTNFMYVLKFFINW